MTEPTIEEQTRNAQELLDHAAIAIETVVGIRAQIEAAGFSRPTAEQMAAQVWVNIFTPKPNNTETSQP